MTHALRGVLGALALALAPPFLLTGQPASPATRAPAVPEQAAPEQLSANEHQALLAEGWSATTGSTINYIDDAACATCHRRIAETFRSVGMSRSFARPGSNGWIEDFEADPFFHAPSGNYYQLSRQGDELWFEQFRVDSQGERLLEVALQVDWVLGSGSVSRTYLYTTPSGEIFQLPIAWYTQGSNWEMAPGFASESHLGLTRLARRECLFCHNAYPDQPTGPAPRHFPHQMPADLPQGIGCQRCHGPGAGHVAAVLTGRSSEEVEQRIVNPADLSSDLQRDVCYQCHMQPSVAISRVRRFGRTDFDFRPGTALVDYLTLLNVVEDQSSSESEERFEINHHGFRLEQSACFLESEGGLLCTQCHDPHRKASLATRQSEVRQTCLGCHPSAGDPTAPTPTHPTAALPAEHREHAECSSCHMPRRRADDVVHAVMTDHKIQSAPSAAELEAFLRDRGESDPVVSDVTLLRPKVDPSTDDLYRAAAVVRAGSTAAALAKLESLLAAHPEPPVEALFDVVRRRLEAGLDASAAIEVLADHSPADPIALDWQGLQLARAQQTSEAIALFEQSLERLPTRAETWFNHGRVLLARGDFEAGIVSLERALELRPNLAEGWYWLARAQLASDDQPAAISSLRTGLAYDASTEQSYVLLVQLLDQAGSTTEARRFLQHGLAHASTNETLREVAQILGASKK